MELRAEANGTRLHLTHTGIGDSEDWDQFYNWLKNGWGHELEHARLWLICKLDKPVLITGGAGGVGHYAIQLAKAHGTRVITTTSTRNREFVRALGADIVIDDTRQTLTDGVTEEVDVVLDTIGEEVLRKAFSVVKRGGWVVSTGRWFRSTES